MMKPETRSLLKKLVLIIAVRTALVALISGDHVSKDYQGWLAVLDAVHRGLNPYHETTFLNWPPLWLGLLIVFDALSSFLGLSLLTVLRGFFAVVECLTVAQLAKLLDREFPPFNNRRLLLFGAALNPIPAILIADSANFDIVVALCSIVALLKLLEFARGRNVRSWLQAAAAIGVGILAKTVPVVLLPALLEPLRGIERGKRLLGLALALLPAALGVGLIYFMAPHDVETKVIGYRSVGGWFGVTGLLYLAGAHGIAQRLYSVLFYLLVLFLMFRMLQPRPGVSPQRRLLFGSALMWLALPTLGSGYGTHYNLWVLYPLLALFPLAGAKERGAILAYFILASATILIQYALLPSFGQFASRYAAAAPLTDWVNVQVAHGSHRFETFLTLPQFISMLWLLFVLLRGGERRDAPA